VLSLESGDDLLAQSVRFPAGRPAGGQSAATLSLEAKPEDFGVERVRMIVRARRLAYALPRLVEAP
jgi:hypothetical protein